jgi:hypothetical protein
MIDETLLITASKAARGITAAQAAVDEAKRLVEEAKAGVEVAKAGLVEAKANYDAVIVEIAGKGIPASKAKKAVEDMLRIFAEVGIIDSGADNAPSEPKPSRRKKSEPAPAATVEPEAPAPQLGEVVGSPATAETDQVVSDPVHESVEEAAVIVEPVGESELETSAATAIEDVEAPVTVDTDEALSAIDNGEAIGEIYQFIEDATEGEDIFVSETLIALLNAADWYSRDHRREPLTVDLYREILNIDFVSQAGASEGIDPVLKAELEAIEQNSISETVFAWFLHVLTKLENGQAHASYGEFLLGASGSANEPQTDGQVTEAESSVVLVDEEIEVTDDGGYIEDPETEEEISADVSDDVTLAADDGLVGVVVEDIEEINFLDNTTLEASKVEVPTPAPATEVEKPVHRGFNRPAFLKKKKD